MKRIRDKQLLKIISFGHKKICAKNLKALIKSSDRWMDINKNPTNKCKFCKLWSIFCFCYQYFVCIEGTGWSALQKVVDSDDHFTKEQAWNILGKLIGDLRIFIEPNVNIHKPIKNQIITIEGIYEIVQILDKPEHRMPRPHNKQHLHLLSKWLILDQKRMMNQLWSDTKIKINMERGSPNQVDAQMNHIGNKETIMCKELKKRRKQLL